MTQEFVFTDQHRFGEFIFGNTVNDFADTFDEVAQDRAEAGEESIVDLWKDIADSVKDALIDKAGRYIYHRAIPELMSDLMREVAADYLKGEQL